MFGKWVSESLKFYKQSWKGDSSQSSDDTNFDRHVDSTGEWKLSIGSYTWVYAGYKLMKNLSDISSMS